MKTKLPTHLNLSVFTLLVIFFTGTNNSLYAQCSEAENATMKKYAELTRNSANTQSCAACASLANLFCIAENGLYKNDKTEVEKAIAQTKETIKLMGDPICCSELLTKSPKWGQPKSENGQTGSLAKQSKAAQDVQEIVNVINNGITTLENLEAIDKMDKQLQNDLEKVEKLMQENMVLSNREYQSEEDINKEYNLKLLNLNELAKTHLALKSKMQSLGYSASGELLSNSSTTGLGVIAAAGAMMSTDKKESKQFAEDAKNRLQNSKSEKMFAFKYKDADFQLDLVKNKMDEYFNKNYPSDFNNFLSYTLVNGYKGGMKYDDFKDLFPKFKLKQHSYITKNITDKKSPVTAKYRMENAATDSEFLVSLANKKFKLRTVELEQVFTYSATFSPEKLKEYQLKILEEIKFYDHLFNLKPTSYSTENPVAKGLNVLTKLNHEELYKIIKSNNPTLSEEQISSAIKMLSSSESIQEAANVNPVNSVTTVRWSDNLNKAFILETTLTVKNETITLKITKTDENLLPLNFN